MKKSLALFSLAWLLTALFSGCSVQVQFEPASSPPTAAATPDVTLYFPADRYPETAEHIQDAIDEGASDVCTIDRNGAEENRKLSLQGIPTKQKFDRDEWPMAMCREGGRGADIAYVRSADNRGAGSWIGNRLHDYPDGTRVHVVVK